MSTINPNRIGLASFDQANLFYYFDIDNINRAHHADVSMFIADIVDAVNLPNPTFNTGLEFDLDTNAAQTVNVGNIGDPIGFYTHETGSAAIPFMQSIDIFNIPQDQVLTGFDADVVYNFVMIAQEMRYQFSALGRDLITYQDIFDLFAANTPIGLSYIPTGPSNPPLIEFTSILSRNPPPNPDGPDTSTIIVSTIHLLEFANEPFDIFVSTGSRDNVRATIRFALPEPKASEILTLADPTDETVFAFNLGTRENLSVRGFQARTYQDLVDTINLFNGVNALYRIDTTTKHQIVLYNPVPKTPTISSTILSMDEIDPVIIARSAEMRASLESFSSLGNTIDITDFVGLDKNSRIVHQLNNSIVGGFDLLTTLQNSKRSNGSYWTEIIIIENDRLFTDTVVSAIPEQAELIEAIADDDTVSDIDKRQASLSLSSIRNSIGTISTTIISKLALIAIPINAISGILATRFDTSPRPPSAETTVVSSISAVIDDGFAPGARDADRNIIDESLLTSGQRNSLLPPPRETID